MDSEAFIGACGRSTLVMKTSMVNTAAFLSAFEPWLRRRGRALTRHGGGSAEPAARARSQPSVTEKISQRKVLVVDSLTAVIGEGMIRASMRSARRRRGCGAGGAHAEAGPRGSLFIMVDDLTFSSAAAHPRSAALAGINVHHNPS
jgi:hypothetical protein